MTSDLKYFHRRSVRLKGYDYTQPGAYFVTIVTQGRKCIFGEILNKEMYINVLGKLVQQCWLETMDHFPNTEVEPYEIMPNHIHAVIIIIEDDSTGTIYRARTMEKFSQPVIGSISTIIRTFKAGVSRLAKRELGIVNIWQRSYYEHIIRNEIEFTGIAGYIAANPENWAHDLEQSI